jgi:hypothetical protein
MSDKATAASKNVRLAAAETSTSFLPTRKTVKGIVAGGQHDFFKIVLRTFSRRHHWRHRDLHYISD